MDMNQVSMMLTKFVFIVLGLIVTRYLVPWLDKKFKVAKNEDIEYWTNVFVSAADQTLGVHCGTDDDKRTIVSQQLEAMFPKLDPVLRAAVAEAAVKKLRQKNDDGS